jgi:NitT/TauT family transport system permease protein
MKAARFDPYLPIIGVVGLIVIWYLAVWYQVVDPVLLPSPVDTFRALWNGMAGGRLGLDFLRTLERTIFAILIAAAIAIPLGMDLSVGGVRHRFLPFHAGIGHVPVIPGAVRGRRQDQDFGRCFRRGARHSV